MIKVKKKVFLIFVLALFMGFSCKAPFEPDPQITEIDISIRYDRFYQASSSGYEWISIEIELWDSEAYFYKSERLEKQADGTYTGLVKAVPTGTKFIAYIDDRMVFPLFEPGDEVKPIGRRIFFNSHECKGVEGEYGNEKVRGQISKSGQITDG